ncbi:MAG: hypothetical protein RLZZ164_400 [Actinomycetota bacterium]|jgi:uncharacterized membrane protein
MNFNIDWSKFETVALAAIGFSALVVIAYSFGVRLLTNAQHLAAKAIKGNKSAADRELVNRILAYALFALSAVAVVWAVVMMFEVMYNPPK